MMATGNWRLVSLYNAPDGDWVVHLQRSIAVSGSDSPDVSHSETMTIDIEADHVQQIATALKAAS